jgi:type IX secretion system PorP/SprF family membrane protein
MAVTDVAGDGFLTNTSVNAVYAYHVALTRKLSMRAAIEGGYVQKSYDFSKYKFGDQIDDRLGFVLPTAEKVGLQQRSFANFSTGVLFYTDKIFGGIAVNNLTEPNQSFYYPQSSEEQFKLPRKYTAHAGANIYLTHQRNEDARMYISPNILYMQQRNFNQLNLGLYLKKQSLVLGGWFRQTSRNTDAVILLVGLKFPKFRVGYSFDATVSGARTATTGSHEITMALELGIKARSAKRSHKTMRCPEF